MSKLLICLVLFGIASDQSLTHAISYRGEQVWRVVPASVQVLQVLEDIGKHFKLDFWKDPVAIGRPVDFRVTPSQAEKVKEMMESRGLFDYQVYISDIHQLVKDQKRRNTNPRKNSRAESSSRTVANFDYSVYHTSEEIYEWIDMVANEFPDTTTKRQIGITYQGRPLYALEFKPNSTASKRPIIFVDALIHCREWISTASLLYIFKEMLTNPAYAHMMNDADWYFIPMINIDGYVETWSGDRLWRKTKSTGPSPICSGVDGNRNWDSQWSLPGASPHPCSYTYYGPTPHSESEIRHLANYILDFGVGGVDAYVTTHSYSQLILYPYGYTATPTADDAVLNVTSKMMHDAIYAVHGTYYTYGQSSTGIYVTSGTTDDWTYDVAGVALSYTFELRDEGQYGFLLPPNQIIPNGEEYLAGLEVLKNYVVNNFDGGL